MKLSSFSASFHEYELNLDYYHGKDILHEGSLLKLDPEYSWERINGKIRNKIRQAQKLDVEIKKVKGTKKDIEEFRTIWFDPEDDTIPPTLEQDEVMYLAYMDGELTGGLILTPSSPTVLYMHNLGSNDTGKRQNIPALILWNAVEDLKDTKWEYIDVGVSFRSALYSFFKNWKVDSYPITFNPPFNKPDIRLVPFQGSHIVGYAQDASKEAHETVKQFFGETFTILPRATTCLKIALLDIGVSKDDSVAVYQTFGGKKVRNQNVKEVVESQAKLVTKIDATTKVVIVIHEFGFPYKDIKKLKKECEDKSIPLIEDCAWSFGTHIDEDTIIGQVGDYAVYSLPKFAPLQYGGILTGLKLSDDDVWTKYQTLDYFKKEIIIAALHDYLPNLNSDNKKRRENWQKLAGLFTRDGFTPAFELPEGVYPGVFIATLPDAKSVIERYEQFGVEVREGINEESILLPVHQSLSDGEIDYIYGAFRGKLNLSSNYQRDGKKG